MKRIKLSAISYLNTAPFAYGLKHSALNRSIELLERFPSECARMFINNEVDISLLPVGSLPATNGYSIIGDYCIGADGDVRTVMLLSNTPLNRIRRIFLDYQSRTSVKLIKILARKYWNISPQWQLLPPDRDIYHFSQNEAVLLIGDKVFEAEHHYPYRYDLAREWKQLTGLPFVFAVWVARNPLPDKFTEQFNLALQTGITSIPQSVSEFTSLNIEKELAISYLKENISYRLTPSKYEAIGQFLAYIQQDEID